MIELFRHPEELDEMDEDDDSPVPPPVLGNAPRPVNGM